MALWLHYLYYLLTRLLVNLFILKLSAFRPVKRFYITIYGLKSIKC
jgi:hypothetical protein